MYEVEEGEKEEVRKRYKTKRNRKWLNYQRKGLD
jgi:hypothetical protein